ncbi:hypothetical protein K4A83_04690 [Spirulina subsalsa FACHB-351]|uniref:Tyrosine kinase G-rich domain-containing protein n=1 Tax=Spirulina subsalsa FACHB-351 TaxID=234711 RepID=A0ABT3L236_9CYAN|nr:hypothetical protein [Spirulina subsalsa]MCW6035572.1 hypothetical protein [Spirulina subsalsa FACHB-351]
MNVNSTKKCDFYLGIQNKFKQREALENAYSNFVEPQINQLIEVRVQSVPSVPVMFAGLGCVSGWLLLTVVYCLWMRGR